MAKEAPDSGAEKKTNSLKDEIKSKLSDEQNQVDVPGEKQLGTYDLGKVVPKQCILLIFLPEYDKPIQSESARCELY